MRHRARRLSVALLALAVAGLPVSAAEIRGKATDLSGGALHGARIALENVATGGESVTTADAEGEYTFGGLSLGIYRVSIAVHGFSQDARNVSVASGEESVEVNFVLALGDLQSNLTVTASRSARDTLVVPLRAESLGRQQLEAKNPTSTGDLMIQAPGVTPVGNGPFQVRPRLRGLDSTRVLILVDGERLNNARTATDRAGVEVGLVDAAAIESVEVVSGSGSVLYGTDALSGTINIITTQAGFSDKLRWTAGLDGYYSSNEDGRRGSLNLGLSDRRFVLGVRAGLEKFDDYLSGGTEGDPLEDTYPLHANGTLHQTDTIDTNFPPFRFKAFPEPFNAPYRRTTRTIPTSGFEGKSVDANGSFSLSDKQSFRVKYLHREAEDVGFPDFEPPQFFQGIVLPHSRLDKVSGRFQARSINSWFSNLTATVYYQHQDRLLRNVDIPVQFPAPSAAFFPINVFRLLINSDTRQDVKTWGVDLQNTFLLSPRNVLTAGFTLYQDDSGDERTSASQLNLVGQVALGARGPAAIVLPSLVPLGPATVTHPVRVPDATFRDFGVFAQDEWDVTNKLKAVLGLRVDGYDVTTQPTPGYDIQAVIAGARPPIDPATLPSPSGEEISRTAFTGDFGLVYRATDTVSLSAHYGRSYRHPNLEELLFAGPATIGSIAPNVEVGPEKGDNFDLGVKLRSGRAAGSLSYFNNKYHGFISTEIVALTASSSISQAINFSDVRIQGIEGDFEAPLTAGRLVVTPFASGAWNRGEILSGRNPLTRTDLAGTPQDNITPFKLIAGARVSDRRSRYWAEYSLRHQAEVERVAQTLEESPFLIAQDLFGLQGFTIHRLGAGIDFRSAGALVGVSAHVENIANEYYREQFQFAPARGRSFTFALRVRRI